MGYQRIVAHQRFGHKKAERLFYQNKRSAVAPQTGDSPDRGNVPSGQRGMGEAVPRTCDTSVRNMVASLAWRLPAVRGDVAAGDRGDGRRQRRFAGLCVSSCSTVLLLLPPAAQHARTVRNMVVLLAWGLPAVRGDVAAGDRGDGRRQRRFAILPISSCTSVPLLLPQAARNNCAS